MTQFYTCEFSNTLNDCREVLILNLHGQAVLIKGNLGILGQCLGRFRRRRRRTRRRCRSWYTTPRRTWHFALGVGVSRQTEAEKEVENTSPAEEQLFRPNHTTVLRNGQTYSCALKCQRARTTGCTGMHVAVVASRPAWHPSHSQYHSGGTSDYTSRSPSKPSSQPRFQAHPAGLLLCHYHSGLSVV